MTSAQICHFPTKWFVNSISYACEHVSPAPPPPPGYMCHALSFSEWPTMLATHVGFSKG